jgi:hypothetical protein
MNYFPFFLIAGWMIAKFFQLSTYQSYYAFDFGTIFIKF